MIHPGQLLIVGASFRIVGQAAIVGDGKHPDIGGTDELGTTEESYFVRDLERFAREFQAVGIKGRGEQGSGARKKQMTACDSAPVNPPPADAWSPGCRARRDEFL